MNYYNEHDPFAAAWLRELIKAGHIAPGEVDERSIEDVLPSDLREFTQCHFFAGIGVWSYALRQAGWPDDRPVWTGSCPCQPFSVAGKKTGTADERHLWPALFHLIRQCQPTTFFGEQVASKDGLAWFDTVQADLEGSQYTVGAADLCSAGFGAPHIRQRLYFVAQSKQFAGREERAHLGGCAEGSGTKGLEQRPLHGRAGHLAHTQHAERGTEREILRGAYGRDGLGRGSESSTVEHSAGEQVGLSGRARQPRETDSGELADSNRAIASEERPERSGQFLQSREDEGVGVGLANNNNTGPEGRECLSERPFEFPAGSRGLVNGYWSGADWVFCQDQKYRPIEPGSAPLATGVTNRVGKLRGYGNALTAPVAQGFIEAYLEVTQHA